MNTLKTLLVITGLFTTVVANAQDTILTVTGEKIPAKIRLVTDKIIVYDDANGEEQVMDRLNVKFTTINSIPDYYTGTLKKMPVDPSNNKNVAGIYLQKSARHKSTSLVLSIIGGTIGGTGMLLSNSKGGRIAFGSLGGAMMIAGFGFNVSSIVNLRKGGETLERTR